MRTLYPMNTPREKHRGYLARLSRLKAERSSWDSHWADLGRYVLPRAPRFFVSDRNRGGREKYGSIIDNTATRCVRVLTAGLMSHVTSPASPWFRLTPRNKDLRDSYAVQVWLDDVVERMEMVFARSNVYRALQQMYEELGVFGTSAVLVLSDFETVIRCYPLTVGEYCLQQDYQGRIVAVYREFQRTVGEVVKEFGYESCSTRVQHAWNNREHESPVDILHVIEPRSDQERDMESPLAKDMPWRSCYLELGSEDGKILREGGYKRMRVLAPRWQVHGGDVYGVSPAMEALGDIRQLQQEQLRKSQAIDYKTRPPLQVPTGLKNRDSSALPGGIRYFEPAEVLPHDQVQPHGGIRTAFEVNLELDHMLLDIQDVRQRIKQAFYEDLFLLLAAQDGRMTAFEVSQRVQERLLMIGPVLTRMNNELLEPLIDLTFQEMAEVGALAPPPEELLGSELQVEFVSILAQAQQSVGISGVQQFMADVLAVSQSRPDVLDVINFDEWARRVAHMRGVDTEILVDEQSVQQLRRARAEAQAAAEQAALAGQQAKAVRDLASAPTGDDTALGELVRGAQTVGAA